MRERMLASFEPVAEEDDAAPFEVPTGSPASEGRRREHQRGCDGQRRVVGADRGAEVDFLRKKSPSRADFRGPSLVLPASSTESTPYTTYPYVLDRDRYIL